MSCVIVADSSYGDCGKGKIVDIYSQNADLIVRSSSGHNCGHTLVVNNEKIVLRLVPSGILHPHTKCLLAQGMVISLPKLFEEIDQLADKGIDVSRIFISNRAYLITSWHQQIDEIRENQEDKIGTTKKGIGPCYEDKIGRRGIRMIDLLDREGLFEKLRKIYYNWATIIHYPSNYLGHINSPKQELELIERYIERLRPMLYDASAMVNQYLNDGKNVLVEGSQGTLLDIDHGIYPFVTSTNVVVGGVCANLGIGPKKIDHSVGLLKAYCTRVGLGPFPTELHDGIGRQLREIGKEFGSVTGRPRRIGWLDLPALRYAIRVNGFDSLAITKLDVLSDLDFIKVCIAYHTPEGITEEFPIDHLNLAKPIYQKLDGWKFDVSNFRAIYDLPIQAIQYVRFIENSVHCPINLVSVGSDREQTIIIQHPFETNDDLSIL